MQVEYKAVDFPGGMLAKATSAANVNKILAQNQGWNPVLLCDGPHMLGPVLILTRELGDDDSGGPQTGGNELKARKAPKSQPEFVCSDCGGDLSEEDKVCPHCGAPIEGD